VEMHGLVITIHEFRCNYMHALERLMDAPQFTPAQRREFPEHIRLIERAEAGNRLLGTILRLLLSDRPMHMSGEDVIARLDACARRLEAWLETDDEG
jgi:hypothetical protein